MINGDVAYFALCEVCDEKHGFVLLPKIGRKKIDFLSKKIGLTIVELCLKSEIVDEIEAEFMRGEIRASNLQDEASFIDFLLVTRSLGIIVRTDIRLARDFGSTAIQEFSQLADEFSDLFSDREVESIQETLQKTHYIH